MYKKFKTVLDQIKYVCYLLHPNGYPISVNIRKILGLISEYLQIFVKISNEYPIRYVNTPIHPYKISFHLLNGEIFMP